MDLIEKLKKTTPAYLILADGTTFPGYSLGARGTTIGEVVFTTGMTGYQETLTDPNYYGQIVTQTFPLIGNYGTNEFDVESSLVWMRATSYGNGARPPPTSGASWTSPST